MAAPTTAATEQASLSPEDGFSGEIPVDVVKLIYQHADLRDRARGRAVSKGFLAALAAAGLPAGPACPPAASLRATVHALVDLGRARRISRKLRALLSWALEAAREVPIRGGDGFHASLQELVDHLAARGGPELADAELMMMDYERDGMFSLAKTLSTTHVEFDVGDEEEGPVGELLSVRVWCQHDCLSLELAVLPADEELVEDKYSGLRYLGVGFQPSSRLVNLRHERRNGNRYPLLHATAVYQAAVLERGTLAWSSPLYLAQAAADVYTYGLAVDETCGRAPAIWYNGNGFQAGLNGLAALLKASGSGACTMHKLHGLGWF
jgi:hypothetical protein